MWVFKTKRDTNGFIERLKARIVARGDHERYGIDFTETFAPTPTPATVRLILALAAFEDLHLHSVDISSAFTYGDLDEEIYMRQPEGFHEGGKNMVCRLNKSLYGLAQASRQWNKKMHAFMLSIGFKRIHSDLSVYSRLKNPYNV